MVVAAGAVAFGIARGRQLTVTARGQHLQVRRHAVAVFVALLRRRAPFQLDRNVEDSHERREPLSRAPVHPCGAPCQRQPHSPSTNGLSESAEHGRGGRLAR